MEDPDISDYKILILRIKETNLYLRTLPFLWFRFFQTFCNYLVQKEQEEDCCPFFFFERKKLVRLFFAIVEILNLKTILLVDPRANIYVFVASCLNKFDLKNWKIKREKIRSRIKLESDGMIY